MQGRPNWLLLKNKDIRKIIKQEVEVEKIQQKQLNWYRYLLKIKPGKILARIF